jgi:hypothetical protein
MSERIRANKYLFYADVMSDVLKSLRQHVTVMTFIQEGRDGGPDMEFELRVTKVGTIQYPATRTPSTKKQFTDRLVRLNARRFATTKGK